MLLLDPLRWLAIGMAIANRSFCKRLSDEVGPRAFEAESWQCFECALGMVLVDPPLGEGAFFAELGIKRREGEKLSQAVIRILKDEANWQWTMKESSPDQKKALELATRIARDSAELASWVKRMRHQ